MSVDPSISPTDLLRRSHSYRNYEPEEFVQAFLNAEGSNREEARVREAMEIMEGGRFEPMLKRAHRMAAHLDLDEAEEWWEDNEELRRWVNAWAFIQHQRRFPLGLTADEFLSESGDEGIVMREGIQDPDNSKTPKKAAEYRTNPDPLDIPEDARCRNCAHFVPDRQTDVDGAICKVVEGEVRPDAVCESFFSDFGLFSDNDMRGRVRISSFFSKGGLTDWTREQVREAMELIKQELEMRSG